MLKCIAWMKMQSEKDGTMGLARCCCDPDAKSGEFYGPVGKGLQEAHDQASYKGKAELMPEVQIADKAARDMLWKVSNATTGADGILIFFGFSQAQSSGVSSGEWGGVVHNKSSIFTSRVSCCTTAVVRVCFLLVDIVVVFVVIAVLFFPLFLALFLTLFLALFFFVVT
jgi:hypothetical protein